MTCSDQGRPRLVSEWFEDRVHPKRSLYTIKPNGTALTKLTSAPYASDLAWSPDGRQLTFDGPNQIYIIDADGSDQTLLRMGGTCVHLFPELDAFVVAPARTSAAATRGRSATPSLAERLLPLVS